MVSSGPPLSPRSPTASLLRSLWMCYLVMEVSWSTSQAEDCPRGCQCTPGISYTRVNCGYAHMRAVPSYVNSHKTEMLNLTGNEIYALSNITFRDPSYLRQLHLSNNQLTVIEVGAFRRMKSLELLDLSENHIQTVDDQLLVDLLALQKLNLSCNQISYVAPLFFYNNIYLTSLDLSQNWISKLSIQLFRNLTHLEFLNLSDNPLHTLDNDVFQSLASLHYLYLINTSLSVIPSLVFRGLQGLKLLDLSHNHLQEFNVSSVEYLSNLSHIYLTGNPFICDCSLQNFRDWIVKKASEMVLTSVCYWPESVSGKSLIDVPSERFCQSGTKISHGNVSVVIVPYAPDIEFVEPYNAMLGWYTAATLSGMLALFLVCVVLDKLKRNYYVYRWRKRMRKEGQQISNPQKTNSPLSEKMDTGRVVPSNINCHAKGTPYKPIDDYVKTALITEESMGSEIAVPMATDYLPVTEDNSATSVVKISMETTDYSDPDSLVVHPECPIHSHKHKGIRSPQQETVM